MSHINWESGLPGLRIAMFGPFRVEIDGVSLKPHRPNDLRALAYLLLNHDSPVERLVVAGLWKKADDKTFAETDARAYLVRAVSELSARLGREGRRLKKPQPQLLLFETTGAELDLLEWETGLADGSLEALERILPLYRRSLLEGWDEGWVQEVRARFRNDYLEALHSATRRATAHGQWQTALRASALLGEVEPWHEETLRARLQLLADRRRFQEMQQLYDAYLKQCEATGDPADALTTRRYRDLRAEADRFRQSAGHGRLPSPLSRFIPRPRDIREICDWVRSERLITLTGPGGIGKTRLSIAAAEEMQEEFYDRAWFLDLSELPESADVPTHVARTLHLTENPTRSATEEILTFLRAREALLVLDNCEHVLEASARLTNQVLERCPQVKILATSREPLGIVGEAVWRVPSLDFPEASAQMTPQVLAQFGAVRLLTERASRPQLPLTIQESNVDAIARICRRLDGIPLAIELASVQIQRGFHSVQEVADSLDEALTFLTEGSRTAPSRQQTLRAAIEWSYRLLTGTEQRVFERLGVFVGGFTEEAVRPVCGAPPVTPEAAVAAVRSLAEKSILELLPSEQGVRYHLLQTIRLFALERLAARQADLSEASAPEDVSADEGTRTHRRHLHYFTAFVEEAERHHRGKDHAHWLDRQDAEHENCRAALVWALQHGEAETGLRLVGNLAGYLYTRGHHVEAAETLAEFLTSAPVTAPARLKAVHWAGNIAYTRADYATARTYFEEGLALREFQGDPRGLAVGRASLATAIGGLGGHEEALALFEANLGVFQALNDLRNTALTWNSIGAIKDAQQDYPGARECHARSLQLFREVNDTANISLAANNLAGLHVQLGDLAAARPLLMECLALYRALRTPHRFVHLLFHYLCLAVREEQFDRAAVIMGFGEAFRESIGYALPPNIEARRRAEADQVCRHLEEARFEAQRAWGAQRTEEEISAFLLEI